MTTERTFAALSVLGSPTGDVTANGQAAHPGPKHARPTTPAPNPAKRGPAARTDVTGRWLIGGACLLLAGLAVAMGITSFHAQFTYIFATKRQWTPAVLEALGLDAGAVTFAVLGIALARLGHRALVERVLVVVCALGSCGMNVLNADLASPRSIAVYGLPPILFALTSDRLIAVIRRAALGHTVDGDQQRSPWYFAGRSALYGLRLAVDFCGTARGLRQAILNAAPLPEAPRPREHVAVSEAVAEATRKGDLAARSGSPWATPAGAETPEHTDPGRPRSRQYRPRRGTKTARFLMLVRAKHGSFAMVALSDVYRISADLAPEVGLHTGSARKALRAAILAAQDGAR